MSKVWKIFKYAFICAAFCGVAGLLLSLTYEQVELRRSAYQQKQEEASLKTLIPGTEIIERQTVAAGQSYYLAYNTAGQLQGYALKVSTRGYSSDIEMLLGLDTDFAITGFEVLSQAETPGLGSKITEPRFSARLLGRLALGLRLNKDGGEIDALTGATITSRAVINSLRQAATSLKSVLE